MDRSLLWTMIPQAAYDRSKTTHTMPDGTRVIVYYLGEAEWSVNGESVWFSGFKDELLESLKAQHPKTSKQK